MPGNLQQIPASVVASWPAPNYNDPVRRTWMPVYVAVLQGAMTLMLGTRLVLRFQGQAGGLGLDDALLIPAFSTATMLTVVTVLGAEQYGLDRHIWDLRVSTLQSTALIGWLAEIAFIISTCCTKVSVLLFYRRLGLENINKQWKYATIGAMIFTIAYGLAFVLALIFNCSPTEAYWKSYSLTYTRKYHCADTTILNPLSGALSVLSDLYSVLLPMGMLWGLEATKHQKWALNGVFSLGLVVVAAGAVRTFYLEKLGTNYDITWLGFDALVWSEAEAHLAICCASAPSLRVFLRRYLNNPISRAINSARSTSGRSAFGGSVNTDTVGIVSYRQGEADDAEDFANEMRKGSNGMHDVEVTSPATSDAPGEQLVRTPSGYESYALHSLHKSRSSQHYISWHQSKSFGE